MGPIKGESRCVALSDAVIQQERRIVLKFKLALAVVVIGVATTPWIASFGHSRRRKYYSRRERHLAAYCLVDSLMNTYYHASFMGRAGGIVCSAPTGASLPPAISA